MADISLGRSGIRTAILQRGTLLNDGFKHDVSLEVLRQTGIKIDPYIADIYAVFDGFPIGVMDAGTGLRLWPLMDVLAATRPSQSRVSFGDFLMESDQITFDLADKESCIMYEDANEKIAESVPDFFDRLLSGNLDFM